MLRKDYGKKNKYLLKNTILFGISSFSSKMLTFFLVPLYTSVLTTREYGISDIIMTTDNLLIYIFTLNIAEAVLRFAIEESVDKNGILMYALRIVMLGGIPVLAGAFFCSYVIKDGWPSYSYLFMFLYYITTAFYNVVAAFVRAIDKLKEVAWAGIISTAMLIGSNISFLLLLKIGLFGYMMSLIVSTVFSTLYLSVVIMRSGTVHKFAVCSVGLRREMVQYSIPLIFNGVCWWINNSVDKYFINTLLDAAYVGIYSIAYKIPLVLFVVQSIFAQAWNLSVIKEFDGDDEDGFISNTYKIYNFSLVICTSFLIVFSASIAEVFFSKEFYNAWPYSNILIIGSLFSALGSFVGGIFVAVKDTRTYSRTTMIAAVINILLDILLIPKFSLYGAAFATAVSFFVMWVMRIGIALRVVCVKNNWIRDSVAYILLIVQILCSLYSTHLYLAQCIIMLLLIIIYKETMAIALQTIGSFVRKV